MARPSRADGNVVRMRGRKLQLRNARLLRREPLCRRCRIKYNRVTPAEVLDHDLPLFKGGEDKEYNLQPLCRRCHDEKSAEDAGKGVWPTVRADGWPDPQTGVRRTREVLR